MLKHLELPSVSAYIAEGEVVVVVEVGHNEAVMKQH